MTDFNPEVFKNFTYTSDSAGNYQCPDSTCGIVFEISAATNALTTDEIRTIWSHVRDLHPNVFRRAHDQSMTASSFVSRDVMLNQAMTAVGQAYGKINLILAQWHTNGSSGTEALQLIKQEHTKVEENLAQILVSSSPQPEPSSSSLSSL